MSFQRVHQSKSQKPQTSWNKSQFAPRPFSVQEPERPPTQEELENQAFDQDKFEATGLQLKEKYGTITPVEQERLGMLQAKMDSYWTQRMEQAKAQPNLLEILIRNTQTTAVPQSTTSIKPKLVANQQDGAVSTTAPALVVKPKLTMVQPDAHYEQVSNEPVTGLVQRQEATAVDLLSPAQTAQAVSFYRSRLDLYPPDVVRKIQCKVHLTETGMPDSLMVQKVAWFQHVNTLKVDGMAGPRTLPRLFKSGLATEFDRKEFVKPGKAVEAEWVTLGTPEARADKLFKGIKARLDEQKVPTPKMVVGDLKKDQGLFEPKHWRITMDRAALSSTNIDDDSMRDLSGTFYHEARHAEQDFKIARMLAAKGNTPEQIHKKMNKNIPLDIAQKAFDNKLPRDIEFATASQQFDSKFGSGRAHYEQAEKEASAAYRTYEDLPTENDAFATQLDFEASWDEATITP